PPLCAGAGRSRAAARRIPARDLRVATRGGPRKGARAVPALSQGRLHDRDRILARAGGRSHRIHPATAAQRRLSHPPWHSGGMIESLATALSDISLLELALIAVMALVASVVGGVAGYGTGALLPLVLVPIVGPEPVVPILSLSALLTNTGR